MSTALLDERRRIAAQSASAGMRPPTKITGVQTRLKMDELFVIWLSLPETQASIQAAMGLVTAGDRISQTPLSPQGPLRHHELVSDSSPPPRSPKSPRKGKSASSQRDPSRSPSGQVPHVHTSTQNVASSTKKTQEAIPQFYFPNAKKVAVEKTEEELQTIKKIFSSKPGIVLNREQFKQITKDVLGFPLYFNSILFSRIDHDKQGTISLTKFMQFWNSQMKNVDSETRWFNAVKQQENNFILSTDFKPYIQILLETHPALDFLKKTPEFQERYAETVVIRIFYKVNRSESGKITLGEIKKSNLIQVFAQVEAESDINKVLEYFSYEHFYVLYCKFWELDTDHDHVIDRDDLQKYGSHSLTHRVIDRIFTQSPKKFSSNVPGKMNYADFCWFLLSEEDKSNETSIEYWFRVLDIDDDGYVSLYEMEYFYVEQLHRMNCLSIEVVQFQDILCQLIDMVKPKDINRITVSDFKSCKLANHVFNILFNLNKFIAYEQKDPSTLRLEMNAPEKTEWDRFARAEYDLLAAEEEGDEDDEQDNWGSAGSSRGGMHNESPF